MLRPYFTKRHRDGGDRIIGVRVVKYAGDYPTIDIDWWWGGVMIWLGRCQPK